MSEATPIVEAVSVTMIDDTRRAEIALRVRLTPKSSRDAVEGGTETPDGPALKVRVRALPEDGAANTALIATVANWLRLPKSAITLTAGARSRTKHLTITCAAADTDRITRLIRDRAAT